MSVFQASLSYELVKIIIIIISNCQVVYTYYVNVIEILFLSELVSSAFWCISNLAPLKSLEVVSVSGVQTQILCQY